MEEKDNKIKILAKTIKIIEDKNDKLDEQLKRLDEEYDVFRVNSDKEKKEQLEMIRSLEDRLVFSIENYQENRISSLRESINNLNQNSVFKVNEDATKKDDELQDILKKTKDEFMKEIEGMKKEFSKEKENFTSILKNKDEIIRKFEDEKKHLKESVKKTCEMEMYKMNLQLKTKDAEIEKLNASLKKYEIKKK